MLGIGGAITYLVGRILRSPLHDKAIIAELERVRVLTEVWIQNQDLNTGELHPAKGPEGDYVYHLASDLDSLLNKYRDDWLSTPKDTPDNERVKRIGINATDSIALIRQHGYVKAKRIRKKELQHS